MTRLLAAALGGLIATLASTGPARAEDSSDAPGSLVVDGVTRTYVAHVPAKLGSSVPLVLSFHGHFSTGEEQSRFTRLDEQSDKHGFIAVYPDGIRRSWNDGRSQDTGSDDVALVKALIADFSRRYPIDPKRIYATGFSNGATFSQYLACSLAERIAAIASVSGYMPKDDAASCRPARPISVLEVGGTADPIEPYEGGEVMLGSLDRGAVLSAKDTLEIWRNNAKCAPSPQVETLAPTLPADGTKVTRTTYAACETGSSVVLYTVAGGGHAWPGGPQYLPPTLIGTASGQLDATKTIVDFFYAHPLP